MLFLLAIASRTFCINADQKNSICLSEEDGSSTPEESKDDKADNTPREVELIAYLHSGVYSFSLETKQCFNVACKFYLSPIKTYYTPPPEC